jgi:hypothetical protein
MSAPHPTIIAEFLTGWIQDISSQRPQPEMERPNILEGIEIPPLRDWSNGPIDGNWHLSYGSFSVHGPKHGIGMTVDPHHPATLTFEYLHDGYHSIKYAGEYLFAGNQATVKTGKNKVDQWERFEVHHAEIAGNLYCTIKCKRDEEYWYVDEEGMIRHRNKKEQGFKCHVFWMYR